MGTIEAIFSAEDQIDYEGQNFIIAHFRVGNVQIAIGKTVEVTAAKGGVTRNDTLLHFDLGWCRLFCICPENTTRN